MTILWFTDLKKNLPSLFFTWNLISQSLDSALDWVSCLAVKIFSLECSVIGPLNFAYLKSLFLKPYISPIFHKLPVFYPFKLEFPEYSCFHSSVPLPMLFPLPGAPAALCIPQDPSSLSVRSSDSPRQAWELLGWHSHRSLINIDLSNPRVEFLKLHVSVPIVGGKINF